MTDAAKQRWVKDLRRGESLVDFFSALDKQMSRTGDGKPFLRMRLGDRSGWVHAVVWDQAEALARQFENGDVVKVDGVVDEYRGRLQVKIRRLRKAEPGEIDPTQFVPASRYPVETMVARLDRVIDSVQDPWLRRLLQLTLGPDGMLRSAFVVATAAREVHHAYVGGLLEHVLEMVRIGRSMAALHPEFTHLDLVTAAILLHDVGKLQEYAQQGAGFVQTREGELMGHIYLGARWLDQRISELPGFPEALREELLHCLLSHHGSLEHGAAVVPRTINAWIVYLADEASARLNQVRRLYEQISDGLGTEDGWSQFDQRLGMRAYAGFVQQQAAQAQGVPGPAAPGLPEPAA